MPPRRARDLQGRVRVAAAGAPPLITLPTGTTPTSAPPDYRKLGSLLQHFLPELDSTQVAELNSSGAGLLPSLDYNELIIALVALIRERGASAAIQFLQENSGLTVRELIFNHPLLEKARIKERIDLEIFRTKIRGSAGVFQCPRCGSRETVSAEKQTRSADEPMTIKITCVACGFNWKKG